jgi:predicted transcriptional regulator
MTGPAASGALSPLSPDDCRRRRQALGLDPYQLARAAGLFELTVIRYEAALVRPRPVTVVALRKTLRRLEAEASETLGASPAA